MVRVSPAIEVGGLKVERGGTPVLRELSFALGPGSVTGLLGPSGSGKTTLMRAIVGVQQVRAGTASVLGEPAGSPGLRSRLAYVTQAPSVYADLTVGENLHYFARILGAPRGRVDEVLETVDMAERGDQLVGELSGGQRARVSLATALLGEPEVLVLDEPTVGLDPVLREDLWTTFRKLADAGAALLVSSHVMDEAAHCDELLLLRDGRIMAQAAPAELLARTGTRDVGEAFLALIRDAAEKGA